MKKKWFTGFIALAASAITLMVPIAWDQYKSKVALEVRVVGKSIVISRPSEIDGLVISYNGEMLNELSKISINISNSGSMPIKGEDVISPLEIKFSEGSSVIDASVDTRNPGNLHVDMKFNRGEGSIYLNFPLLNPGDSIGVSALSKTKDIDFNADARIAGLTKPDVVKMIPQEDLEKAKPWYMYALGALSVFMMIISLAGFSDYPLERRVKRQFREGSFSLPLENDKETFVGWIEKTFRFTTPAERAALKELVRSFPDDIGVVARHESTIRSQIKVMLESSMSNLTLALSFFAFGVVGFYFAFVF